MDNPYESKRKLNFSPDFTIYIDDNNEWRWTIRAKNHEIIGSSSEGFTSKQNSLKNLKLLTHALVKFHAKETEINIGETVSLLGC